MTGELNFLTLCIYIYIILMATRFKNPLRLEAGYPALRCHNLEEEHLPNDLKKYRRDLKKYRRGLVSSELLSETEIFFLLETKSQQQAASERRAVKEDELPAELEQQGQRDEARRRLSHLQQVPDQRRAELQQRFADRAVHLAQRQLKNLR